MAIKPKLNVKRAGESFPAPSEETDSVEGAPVAPNNKFKQIIITCLLCGVATLLVVASVNMFRGDKETPTSPITPNEASVESDGRERPWITASGSSPQNSSQSGYSNTPDSSGANSGTAIGTPASLPLTEGFSEGLQEGRVNAPFEEGLYFEERGLVNFEKKRSVTDEGVEFYWLDARYQDKKVIVPISYQESLWIPDKDIALVDIEFVQVRNSDGTTKTTATKFSVVPNYPTILNSRE